MRSARCPARRGLVALLSALAVGCGGRAQHGDPSPAQHAELSVQVPVYLMRPDEPSGEPTLHVPAQWSASGGTLSEGPWPESVCLPSRSGGGSGSLLLELAESVNLSALGVTGAFFTTVVGGSVSSRATFGVIEIDGDRECQSQPWGDSALLFSGVSGACTPSDGAPDPALIRSLFWSADFGSGDADYSFCVSLQLIDDSYIL
jgi:hypothetical protein